MTRWVLPLALGVVLALSAAAAEKPAPMLGYSIETGRAERAWEERFRAIPDPGKLRDWMKILAARPHALGSPRDKENAQWILARLQDWGWDAHIETFDVLFASPKKRLLEMIGPETFTALLTEPPVPGDPTTEQQSEQLPPYNAFSADGDVTGPLVYVNYGGPEDYRELERHGISVRGAVVIARYGHNWRGLKPKLAADHGAIGCLIYSDPRDDGFSRGETYPDGPWRPRNGVQRGSVLETLYEGDPLTPGIAATPGARRLALADVPIITRIPVLPISYGDAEPLLKAVRGPVGPESWRGGLGITYHMGPGPARVHLQVLSNWDRKTIFDVIAKIPGTIEPDHWILRGNHHDAWVNGAEDPVAGVAALLEEARALGQLHREGWRPRRTIFYCAWDGEEAGLFGSTEWVELHERELARQAAAYVNSDSNTRGYLRAAGSHTLEHLINGVARDVVDPEKNISIGERERLRRIRQASSARDKEEARAREDLRIGALGSGSDYTTFLDHVGIACLNLGFAGEGGGGVYHSAYDDYAWYSRFADTDFSYGRALAQTAGSAVMRLADAPMLPFEFSDFADAVRSDLQEVERLATDRREQILEKDREIEEGVFTATSDPREPSVAPQAEPAPAPVDLGPLESAVSDLTRAAQRWKEAAGALLGSGGMALDRAPLTELNDLLVQSERRLTDPAGLPGRPYFRHLLYAPGTFTGYGAKTLPGPREALEQGQWHLAEQEAARAGRALENEARLIDEVAARLEALSGGPSASPGKPVEPRSEP